MNFRQKLDGPVLVREMSYYLFTFVHWLISLTKTARPILVKVFSLSSFLCKVNKAFDKRSSCEKNALGKVNFSEMGK